MKHLAARITVAACLATVALGATARGDSIFDAAGAGRDVMPAVGDTRALGGAVTANLDPFSVSLLNPCAAARAKQVIITGGFAEMGTKTTNLGQTKTTVTTVYPSLTLIVPTKHFALLTGLFQEREGRVTLADTGSVGTSIYDASYSRGSSVHSIPLMLSAFINRRVALSGGMFFSFSDMREETAIDFRSSDYKDTDDVMDTFAAGEGFIGAFVLDLGRLRLGGQFRTGPRLKGKLEKRNAPIGLWSSENISISSKNAFGLGLAAEPATWVTIEGDYSKSPWSGLKLDQVTLNARNTERWSIGIQYHGDHIWQASQYPLTLGYHREPLDRQAGRLDKIATGRISEEIFSLGTSIPMGQGRGRLSLAFEFGTRKAAARDDLREKTYGISLSVSAAEAWHREARR
ncbi:MAG TPA: hypothetical protein VMU02_03160 [bacterium]|nr:hypothetical protein [bacterium]